MFDPEFWKDLGNIFDAVMNYQKKNVEFNNRFINPWIRLGNVFERQDQTNDAVQAYQRATEIDPDAPQNWVDLGDAHFKNGAYADAIEAYGKAVTLDPEAGWPLGNLALCLVTLGKTEQAIPLYKKSIDLLPDIKDKAICWNRLGNAYRKLNDYENAFLAFQKADQLDGENTGFNDTLDETSPNTSVVAPEEILDQMIVEQILEEGAESIALEDVNETIQETADGRIALAPNMEMKVEERIEEEVAQTLNEAVLEEPTSGSALLEEETPLTLHDKNFDILQIVENVIAKVEQIYAEEEEEEEASTVVAVSAVSEESAREIESSVMSPDIPLNDETQAVSEAVTMEVESILEEAGTQVELSVANEAGEEEQVNQDAPRRIPAWLVINDRVKVKESEAPAELTQVESVTTLSDISQETAVSESAVNMDVVETYTDPLAAQLTTEPSLSEGSLHEAADQAEGGAFSVLQDESEHEAQAVVAVDESNPVIESAGTEESFVMVVEEKAAEMAYEEYLKDMAEPVNILIAQMDEKQSEAPITKVSKNGEVRIAMDTKNAHVWNELGNIYLNASAYDDAVSSYSKAIELDRHFAWPYSNLALAYVQKGRFAEAVLLYQRGIELFNSDKDKAITWNRLGNVYRRINDYGNAIAAYQTADELDPENATLSLRSSFGLLGNMYADPKPALVA